MLKKGLAVCFPQAGKYDYDVICFIYSLNNINEAEFACWFKKQKLTLF